MIWSLSIGLQSKPRFEMPRVMQYDCHALLCTSSQNAEESEMMIVAGINNIADNLNLLAYSRKLSASAEQ